MPATTPFIVVALMNCRVMIAHHAEFGSYSGAAEQLTIAAGGLIVCAGAGLGRLAFGVCALLFGGAHFFYMNLTAQLVPRWLPPSQVFWTWATGLEHIAAGIAILSSIRARFAAILLTVIYAFLHHARARADAAS